MKTKTNLILAALTVGVLVGCDNPPIQPVMPEVNDENCQIEKIQQIEDKGLQQQFAGMCSRRSMGPNMMPANPKKW